MRGELELGSSSAQSCAAPQVTIPPPLLWLRRVRIGAPMAWASLLASPCEGIAAIWEGEPAIRIPELASGKSCVSVSLSGRVCILVPVSITCSLKQRICTLHLLGIPSKTGVSVLGNPVVQVFLLWKLIERVCGSPQRCGSR